LSAYLKPHDPKKRITEMQTESAKKAAGSETFADHFDNFTAPSSSLGAIILICGAGCLWRR
jgi:hypothetical protein